jgi:hypothetical protein
MTDVLPQTGADPEHHPPPVSTGWGGRPFHTRMVARLGGEG